MIGRRRGFTFVELMLAASIFAVVAIVIYSTFGTGISAWRRAERAQNLYQDIRLALDIIARDLENAVLFYDQESEFPNFVGENNKLSFYGLVDLYREIPVHPELKKITYSLDESQHILQRLEQNYPESMQETPEQPQAIAAKISNFTLSYYYIDENREPPYCWGQSWNYEESIPRGIKIELQLDAEEELVFTKYIFIPTGESKQEEEIEQP